MPADVVNTVLRTKLFVTNGGGMDSMLERALLDLYRPHFRGSFVVLVHESKLPCLEKVRKTSASLIAKSCGAVGAAPDHELPAGRWRFANAGGQQRRRSRGAI